MADLSQIEQALTEAMKKRNQVAVDTLRGLKTRIENERIARGQSLTEADISVLVRSELKRRNEAAESYKTGGRPELAEKELAEAKFLSGFLPPQLSEAEISSRIDQAVSDNGWTVKDFGAAMGKLKAELGDQADGATIAKLLKTKLS